MMVTDEKEWMQTEIHSVWTPKGRLVKKMPKKKSPQKKREMKTKLELRLGQSEVSVDEVAIWSEQPTLNTPQKRRKNTQIISKSGKPLKTSQTHLEKYCQWQTRRWCDWQCLPRTPPDSPQRLAQTTPLPETLEMVWLGQWGSRPRCFDGNKNWFLESVHQKFHYVKTTRSWLLHINKSQRKLPDRWVPKKLSCKSCQQHEGSTPSHSRTCPTSLFGLE